MAGNAFTRNAKWLALAYSLSGVTYALNSREAIRPSNDRSVGLIVT